MDRIDVVLQKVYIMCTTLIHAVVSLSLLCQTVLAQKDEPATSAPLDELPQLAGFDDAKSSEDLIRVKRRAIRASINFFDAADMQPIEGVPIAFATKSLVSNNEGNVIFDIPEDPGIYSGIDGYVMVSSFHVKTLKKRGKPIDKSKLLLPLFVKMPLANHPSGEPMLITVPLHSNGIVLHGMVNVDASAADLSESHQRIFQRSLDLIADAAWAGGTATITTNQEVTVGPVPHTTRRGYVRAINDFIPVDLKDGFSLNVVLEKKLAAVRVELPDAFRMVKVASQHTCTVIEGATLIRLSDGHVFSSRTYPRGPYLPTNIYVPPGKFVVLPGAFFGCSFHLAIADALREGIDVTQYELTTVEVGNADNATEELPTITVQASVADAITAVERIQQELAKRKVAAETVTTSASPSGEKTRAEPNPK